MPMYKLTNQDINEMRECLEYAQEQLNKLFKKQQQNNVLPESALRIAKEIGRLNYKIAKLTES
jgi:hypothetical protein